MRIPSNIARLARPVRTLASSRLSASIALFSPLSSSLRTSFTMGFPAFKSFVGGLRDERADRLAHHGPADVALLAQIEHQDRQPIISAERNRRRVHHLQVPLQHVEVAEPREA